MKKKFWIILLIIYPLIGVISIPLFRFAAYSKWFYNFSFRNILYRFLGWNVIPFYSIGGFVILLIIMFFVIVSRFKK